MIHIAASLSTLHSKNHRTAFKDAEQLSLTNSNGRSTSHMFNGIDNLIGQIFKSTEIGMSRDPRLLTVHGVTPSRLFFYCYSRTNHSGTQLVVIILDSPIVTVFDISGGKRAFLEKDEAETLLKPLSEKGNQYNKICFSNRSFGVEAARVVEPILESLKDQLTEVDLSDFIAGRPEAEALEVMKIFSSALQGCTLKYLNLSENAMGEKGVRAFGTLLKSQSNLEELYFMNDGISEEAAKAISELIPSTEKLKVLHFHNNMTGDEGAIAISEVVRRSIALEDFRCSSTRVGSEGGVALIKALKVCANLKKLAIRDNMFGVEGVLALSFAISSHIGLLEVYLSDLNLEDEGAIALANCIKKAAPSLEVLEMAGNSITVQAAMSIASCIASKQFLKKVNLSDSRSVANALVPGLLPKQSSTVEGVPGQVIPNFGCCSVVFPEAYEHLHTPFFWFKHMIAASLYLWSFDPGILRHVISCMLQGYLISLQLGSHFWNR
ncbi:RAN GTPase-activating protein 2 [Ranunculus cassubicifolius]